MNFNNVSKYELPNLVYFKIFDLIRPVVTVKKIISRRTASQK